MKRYLSSLFRWLPPVGVLLFGSIGIIPSARATTYFWDADGVTPGFTALPTGTWGTSAFWSTDATGSSAGANTPITSTDDVNFGTAGSGFSTTSSTVTISGTQSVNNITFGAGNTANLTLSGGTSLTLGSSSTITNNSASNLTIATVLAGTAGFTKAGTGTLTLSGNNSYSGTTTVSAGTLIVSNNSALGTSAVSVSSSGLLQLSAVNVTGQTLALTGASSSSVTLQSIAGANSWSGNLTINPASNTRISANSNTSLNFAGNIALSSTSTDQLIFQGNGTISVSGVISGTSIVSRSANGTGTLSLAGENTYTGKTNVLGATLSATSLNSVATNAGLGTTHAASSNLGAPVTVANGTIGLGSVSTTGTLVYLGTGETTDRVLNLAANTGGGVLDQSGTGLLKFTSSLTATGVGAKTFTLQGSTVGTGELAGVIVDSSGGATSLTKAGTGTWTLSAANTYTGLTTVNAGTLVVGSSGSLASGNDLTLDVSGAATFANAGQTLDAVSNANTTSNALNFTASTGTVTLASLSGAGSTRFGSDGVVTGGIASGTVTAVGNLSANISGGTTTVGGLLTGNISAGTVGAGSLSATTVSGGTNTITGAAGITTLSNGATTVGGVATIGTLSGGTANLNGATSAITTLNGGSVNLGASTVLTVSDGTTSGTIAGTGGSLTKISSGTLTLNAANTYTGLTTVNAGMFAIGSGGSLASGNALTLGANGAADFANAGQTLGAVSNANTTANALNFSAATGTVTLASLSGAGNTRFGSAGVVTGGIASGTVTSVGNLTANISGGTTTVGGVATIDTLSGGTANLNGATSAITTLNGGTVNLGASTTLSVSGGTSAGVIAGTGGSLTKIGSGTLTLTGTNTYTGTTTVSAGTLALNPASGATLTNTTAVVIGSGGTVSLGAANPINASATLTLNGGTLASNGFNQTLGTLDLNTASALNLGGSAALAFADSSALDWNSATLSISNFVVGTNSLRFGTTAGGLTATQLGLFRFAEFGNTAAQIDASGFIAPTSSNYLNSGSSDLVISTAITGTTTVDQTGTASTTLTGTNTSTGLASVTQGTLVIGTVVGGNWTGNVTVGGNGILKGRGTITGAVVVNSAGTYSPGNSPAIQHVGSLTVNSGGFVTIELDGSTAGTGAGFHDQIISAGAVTLNGGTLRGQTIFSGSSGYLPTIGAVHAVITGSAVTGKFAAYNFDSNPAGFSFLPEYTATAVNLYAVPSNYATAVAGINANQIQVGTALQSLRNSGLPFELDQRTTLDARSTLFNGLKTKDTAGLRTAYDQLSPEKLTALSAVTFQSSSLLNSSLLSRSAELRRAGPASVSLNGAAIPAPEQECTMETVIEDGVHYQIAKTKPKKRVGYFADATGAFAAVDGSSERLGSFSQTGAGSAGLDYAVTENQSVGLVVSQALADTDFPSASGSARTTTSRVGVFHDYHQNGFYVNNSVSAGFSTYETQRKIAFLNQTATGETQGLSYGGQLATGYDFPLGGFILGPTASVAYDHARIDSFDETGSAADLRVVRQNADSLITKLGVHVSRPFVAQKIGWIPDLSLSASRQSFTPNPITARLAAGGDAFRVNPPAAGSEYINPGASLAALLPNGWTVRLSYDAILNPQSAEHRINLSLNAGF
jgi:fibronectin-binding autotransporter adhesin